MNKHHNEVEKIADLIGIKLAPYEMVINCYPDEYLGMEFDDEEESGAKKARKTISKKTQEKLIKAFRSHDWLVSSDIYGHNGLSQGGSCKKCKRKFKFPEPDIRPEKESSKKEDKQDWRRKFSAVSEDFILAYHYIYGQHKRFGGRITKCKK